tara:strand:- start:48 stop:173 length:126 start_codon:yes stop_codon:yes gene_type:complete
MNGIVANPKFLRSISEINLIVVSENIITVKPIKNVIVLVLK